MKPRNTSTAGNPIRRPPDSGGNSSGLASSGGGYASSSGYSSGASSSSFGGVGRDGDEYDEDEYEEEDEVGVIGDMIGGVGSARGGISKRGINRSGGSGGAYNRSLPNTPNNNNNASSFSSAEQVQIARLFFALACLWPLLFLLIPPNNSSSSHVALLSTGMDTMDSASLSQHIRHLDSTKQQQLSKGKLLHDKIDKLRWKVSTGIAAKRGYLREEMKSLLHRTEVVGYGSSQPRVAIVVTVPPPSTPDPTHHEYEERMLLHGALETVESIFRATDRNRIFVVTVIMDGRGKVGTFESKLGDIDAGRTAHRHGNSVHTHDHHRDWKMDDGKKEGDEGGEGKGEEEAHSHSEKIHTIYNPQTLGTSASRRLGVQFINILQSKHEEAGLKSPEEELILLFLRCDAQLRENDGHEGKERTWLDDVTDALIVAPPEESENEGSDVKNKRAKKNQQSKQQTDLSLQSMSPANAVSFVVDFSSSDKEGNISIHPSRIGDTLSFDSTLHPVPAHASGQDMSLTNGESYPTPLTGVATALRLNTYNSLPATDDMLTNHYAADMELSFNLWMCADGIDVLGNSLARVVVDPSILSPYEKAKLPGPLAARIVSAWMAGHGDEAYSTSILQNVAKEAADSWQSIVEGHMLNPKDHTMAEQRVLKDKEEELKHALVRIASEARGDATFPIGLDKKCRPFGWYAEHVHPQMEIQGGSGDDSGDGGGGGMQQQSTKEKMLRMEQQQSKKEKLLPSQPLSPERMSIVSKASPVKLAYVDASGGHTSHPHMGATDEEGNYGYVHDETALFQNPPPFSFQSDAEHERLCKKGDPNWKMLTQKVYVDLTNHEAAERRAEHGLAKKKRVKIFCLVYTIEKYHDRIPAIRETWGQKCDGFMVASTKTDKKLGTVNIPHEGPEEYNNIWQKVRSMWSYIYDNYYEKYDYFHIGGDDLYLIVENLRLYLESEEIQLASNGGQYLPDGSEDTQVPLFLGRRFAENGNRDRMFLSGGSGYTMNKAALKTLVVDGFPQCFPHFHTFSEDVMVATCFRKMDIVPYDTKDEEGGERYMPFQPGHHLTYRPPKNPKDDWYSNYSVDVKWGIDHCAAKSVAFHYIKEDLMKRMHAILYHHC